MHVRNAGADDLAAIVDVYNWYIEHSDATFDVEPATVATKRDWFATFDTCGRHRLVVAEEDGRVCGFAGSLPYRPHPAFDTTVELTIYLHPRCTGRGIGSLLYERLLGDLAGEPIHRMLAAIALPNDASEALHRRFGFVPVGVFDEYATKRGRHISSLWMQREA